MSNGLDECDKCNTNNNNGSRRSQSKTQGIIFLAGLAGMGITFGFGLTLAMAKKKDPHMFTKGLIGTKDMPQSGGGLAMKALGWGTLYATTGVGIISYAIWKLVGARSMEEFTAKLQSVAPTVPKKAAQGRNEFQTVGELVDYILDEDAKSKTEKKS